MQVITTRHGPGKLATKVFFSSEDGFNVASVIASLTRVTKSIAEMVQKNRWRSL